MTSVGFYNDQIVSFVNGWKFSGAVRTDCCDLCVGAMPSDRINYGGDLWVFISVGFFIIQNGTTLTRIRFHSIVDHTHGVSNSIATSSCVVPLLAQ
jgi:hypothetical protein